VIASFSTAHEVDDAKPHQQQMQNAADGSAALHVTAFGNSTRCKTPRPPMHNTIFNRLILAKAFF
jgi:hypothetical protein